MKCWHISVGLCWIIPCKSCNISGALPFSRTGYKMLSQSLVFTYGWDWITFQQGNKCCKYSSILFVQRIGNSFTIAYRLLFLDCSQDLLLHMVKQFSARDQAYRGDLLADIGCCSFLGGVKAFADGSLMGFRSASALFHEVLTAIFSKTLGPNIEEQVWDYRTCLADRLAWREDSHVARTTYYRLLAVHLWIMHSYCVWHHCLVGICR